MKDIFASGLSDAEKIVRLTAFQDLIKDLLAHLPASSVEVEKQHAGVQVESDSRRAGTKRATPLQRDSYILAALQDHNATLQAVEAECIGSGKRQVNCLLRRARLLDSTAPAACLRQKRGRFTAEGGVKGRKGLLRGMLPQA